MQNNVIKQRIEKVSRQTLSGASRQQSGASRPVRVIRRLTVGESSCKKEIDEAIASNKKEEETFKTEQQQKQEETETFQTSAEYYLETKTRSGSLSTPYSELTEKQRKELHQVFNLFDFDRDNYLNKDDFKHLYGALDEKLAADSNVTQLINTATNKESDQIDTAQFGDFFGATYFGQFSRSELRYVFDLFDKNHDSFISADDLKQVFESLGWSEKIDAEKMVLSMDKNRDGRVCFEDFRKSMSNFPY